MELNLKGNIEQWWGNKWWR